MTGLKDIKTRATVRTKLNRVRLGLLGDCKSVGEGVSELRVHFGPGYRIYFGRTDKIVVILLCGGSKKTQKRDIKKAFKHWQDFKRRES